MRAEHHPAEAQEAGGARAASTVTTSQSPTGPPSTLSAGRVCTPPPTSVPDPVRTSLDVAWHCGVPAHQSRAR